MPTRLTPELEAEIKRRAQFANVPDDIHALLAEIDALREELDDTKMALGLERADNAFKTALWETAIRDTAQLRKKLTAAKAGLVWSDELPTEEGYYWQRDNPQDIKPAPARIIDAPRLDGSMGAWALFPGNEQEFAVEHIGGQWAGPIAPPVDSGEECVFCGGSGKCPECDQGMAWNGNDSCDECHGSGDCAACGGEGEV